MALNQPATVELSKQLILYCATCRYEKQVELVVDSLRKPFNCPNEKPDEKHHAEVVIGKAGKFWLNNEWRLYIYESKNSLMRILWNRELIPEGNVGLYLLYRLLAVFVSVLIADFAPNIGFWRFALDILCVAVAAVTIIDVLLANTSIAFVSRYPGNILRSAIFTLISYFTLTVSFAVFFIVFEEGLNQSLDWLIGIYFSIVTITTLGYGEIRPATTGIFSDITQGLVILEVVTGLYFILIILGSVTAWGTTPPSHTESLSIDDLLEKYGSNSQKSSNNAC